MKITYTLHILLTRRLKFAKCNLKKHASSLVSVSVVSLHAITTLSPREQIFLPAKPDMLTSWPKKKKFAPAAEKFSTQRYF